MSRPISDPVFDIGRDLQRAYDEGYKQGRYDEKVETETSLPSGEQTHALRTETHACDLIKRQDAIDALDCINGVEEVLRALPSAQPEQDREFIKLTVRNSNGRPYYSIIYLEVDDNGVGHDFEGYSSYSLDVISDYLKKYFIPSAQPERKKGEWDYSDDMYETRVCSVCGFDTEDYKEYNFCPNCGAEMLREDNK